jgi:membrane fusion protein, epimerase transport system
MSAALTIAGGGQAPAPAVSDSATGPIVAGIAILILFFGALGGWAAIAPLNAAVVADGIVTVEGSRKPVQHLEGGIVGSIDVADGQFVNAGDTLMTLNDTTARAQFDIFFQQLALARAMEARLKAELNGESDVTFPDDLLASDAPYVLETIASQRGEFAARRDSLLGGRDILLRRVDQLLEQVKGSTSTRTAYEEQLTSLTAERARLDELLKDGLATRGRISDLERNIADVRGRLGELEASTATSDQKVAEIEQQIAQLTRDRQSEVAELLATMQSKILEIVPQLQDAQSRLERSIIRSPADGRIVGLAVHAAGVVIAPGQILLEIVPEKATLVVEARIRVEDISELRAGMPAELRFSSYRQHVSPLIRGAVQQVSADRITDERTLDVFYKAMIEVDAADLAGHSEIALYPGMGATVLITTEQRTALDYLLSPLAAGFDRAFKQR